MRQPRPSQIVTRLVIALALALVPRVASAELLAAWTFDEGTGEAVKSSGPKPLTGQVIEARFADGVRGKALEFKGPDYEAPAKPPGSLVRVEGSEKLNPKSKVEVRASVYPTFTPVAWGGIVEKGVGFGSSYRLLMLRNGKARATIGNEHVAVDSPEALKLDAWTKLAMSYDGKTLRLFIDGKEVASAPAAVKSLESESPIEIGRRFTGRIDDVEIAY